MRRAEKEIRSRAEIDELISGCRVCRLAFAGGGEPYVVPLSFGYDGSALYFHTAREGKKIGCMEGVPRVCFELERKVFLVVDADNPCRWSFAFESVIGYGSLTELLSDRDREYGLNLIIGHYGGQERRFEATDLGSIRVWRLAVESATGKRSGEKSNPAPAQIQGVDERICQFTPEQMDLWRRVEDLWLLAAKNDQTGVRSALHPDYAGWETGSPLPHDREFAVRSVSSDAPSIIHYDLDPLSVRVYDGRVGIVHYRYAATVAAHGEAPRGVSGRWTEVYLKQDSLWLMIGVQGGPTGVAEEPS